MVEYRHDNEQIAVHDYRYRQNESQHQHVDVKRTVRVRFGGIVPRARRPEAFQYVFRPAENRWQSDQQTVDPHEHAHLNDD